MKGERRVVRQRLFVRFNFIYQRITYREGITYPDYPDTPRSPLYFSYVNIQRDLNFWVVLMIRHMDFGKAGVFFLQKMWSVAVIFSILYLLEWSHHYQLFSVGYALSYIFYGHLRI